MTFLLPKYGKSIILVLQSSPQHQGKKMHLKEIRQSYNIPRCLHNLLSLFQHLYTPREVESGKNSINLPGCSDYVTYNKVIHKRPIFQMYVTSCVVIILQDGDFDMYLMTRLEVTVLAILGNEKGFSCPD